jgi:hypothetical protein
MGLKFFKLNLPIFLDKHHLTEMKSNEEIDHDETNLSGLQRYHTP